MQRLKTRPQFVAAMAGGTVSRTPHFALHRLDRLPGPAPRPDTLPSAWSGALLFATPGPWLGAMVPKRWARRAVTRNTIRRQIYAIGQEQAEALPPAAHVVRLRATFDRQQFVSATSVALRQAVRQELLQLFAHARRRSGSPA